MDKNRHLVTGETYSLSELFGGERRIIIPDLQRDYCWGGSSGDVVNGKVDLVAGFVRCLVAYSRNYSNEANPRKFNIGIVYGYESPANHVQLCDGQQRITTLYLLIGMLNRRLDGKRFSQLLVTSDNDGEALREPYLQYAIRESSLYFLRDLLNDVFLVKDQSGKSGIGEVVKKCDWYFGDYDFDPSIQSMIGALTSIESELSCLKEHELDSLGNFLVNGLSFMYYDLENRSNGEETFVVINTTGEPLSPTENLKPLVIDASINNRYNGIASDWEEIETWFWGKRDNGNDTADAGFNEFLRWVAILHYAGAIDGYGGSLRTNANEIRIKEILASTEYVFPVHEVSFMQIRKCWEVVKFLFDDWESRKELDEGWLSPEGGYIDQIDCLRLLPLIAWKLKHYKSDDVENERNLIRMHHFLANIAKLGDVAKSVNEVFCDAIYLAIKFDDIADAAADKSISNRILTKEERRKLNILAVSRDRRTEIEEAFWHAQNDEILFGEIAPLLDWSTMCGRFNFDIFKTYAIRFCEVFHPKDMPSIDLVRRALLSYDLKGYPVRNGSKNLSFCGENWQWKAVIFANSKMIKGFLDELSCGNDLQSIIDRCDPTCKWFDIARDGFLLDYCEKKNIQEDQAEGVLLIKSVRATTYIPLAEYKARSELKNTRERFGAEGIDYYSANVRIGFHRKINGRVWFFQRWLNPNQEEVDLYLMKNGTDVNSYYPGSNPQGENDLERFICIRISDKMSAQDIARAMGELIEMV